MKLKKSREFHRKVKLLLNKLTSQTKIIAMKKTFTILGLLIAFTIHAQDWSPIMTNQKMNYKHSDSAYITNTIWVDSVEIDNNDSLFYLNRIVKDVPNNQEIVLRNQPQFFSTSIIQQESGNYYFASPFNYFIPTLAGIGDTWDFTNSISAEVTNITEDNIFGVQDSIKTISLSDGNEIWLSKNFGILKFPDFENGGYFELIGIQDTDFGEQVIDFWDIFDFEAGDVQQRYSFLSHPPHIKVRNTKILFNSKEIFNDHITYDVYKVTGGYDSWSGQYSDYSDIYSGSISYSLDEYERVNNFQNELILLEDYYCEQTGDNFAFGRISVNNDSLNLMTKHWGTHFDSPLFQGLYYETSITNDTLTTVTGECLALGPHGMTYTESLGVTLKLYDDNIETIDYSYLTGYIKDGDTVGEITPDSVLITNIEEKAIPKSTFNIYPNPCKAIVNFKSNAKQIVFPIKFELRNTQGLTVKETLISEKEGQVDVSQISQGIYFYSIKSGNKIIQSGKLVVQ